MNAGNRISTSGPLRTIGLVDGFDRLDVKARNAVISAVCWFSSSFKERRYSSSVSKTATSESDSHTDFLAQLLDTGPQ